MMIGHRYRYRLPFAYILAVAVALSVAALAVVAAEYVSEPEASSIVEVEVKGQAYAARLGSVTGAPAAALSDCGALVTCDGYLLSTSALGQTSPHPLSLSSSPMAKAKRKPCDPLTQSRLQNGATRLFLCSGSANNISTSNNDTNSYASSVDAPANSNSSSHSESINPLGSNKLVHKNGLADQVAQLQQNASPQTVSIESTSQDMFQQVEQPAVATLSSSPHVFLTVEFELNYRYHEINHLTKEITLYVKDRHELGLDIKSRARVPEFLQSLEEYKITTKQVNAPSSSTIPTQWHAEMRELKSHVRLDRKKQILEFYVTNRGIHEMFRALVAQPNFAHEMVNMLDNTSEDQSNNKTFVLQVLVEIPFSDYIQCIETKGNQDQLTKQLMVASDTLSSDQVIQIVSQEKDAIEKEKGNQKEDNSHTSPLAPLYKRLTGKEDCEKECTRLERIEVIYNNQVLSNLTCTTALTSPLPSANPPSYFSWLRPAPIVRELVPLEPFKTMTGTQIAEVRSEILTKNRIIFVWSGTGEQDHVTYNVFAQHTPNLPGRSETTRFFTFESNPKDLDPIVFLKNDDDIQFEKKSSENNIWIFRMNHSLARVLLNEVLAHMNLDRGNEYLQQKTGLVIPKDAKIVIHASPKHDQEKHPRIRLEIPKSSSSSSSSSDAVNTVLSTCVLYKPSRGSAILFVKDAYSFHKVGYSVVERVSRHHQLDSSTLTVEEIHEDPVEYDTILKVFRKHVLDFRVDTQNNHIVLIMKQPLQEDEIPIVIRHMSLPQIIDKFQFIFDNFDIKMSSEFKAMLANKLIVLEIQPENASSVVSYSGMKAYPRTFTAEMEVRPALYPVKVIYPKHKHMEEPLFLSNQSFLDYAASSPDHKYGAIIMHKNGQDQVVPLFGKNTLEEDKENYYRHMSRLGVSFRTTTDRPNPTTITKVRQLMKKLQDYKMVTFEKESTGVTKVCVRNEHYYPTVVFYLDHIVHAAQHNQEKTIYDFRCESSSSSSSSESHPDPVNVSSFPTKTITVFSGDDNMLYFLTAENTESFVLQHAHHKGKVADHFYFNLFRSLPERQFIEQDEYGILSYAHGSSNLGWSEDMAQEFFERSEIKESESGYHISTKLSSITNTTPDYLSHFLSFLSSTSNENLIRILGRKQLTTRRRLLIEVTVLHYQIQHKKDFEHYIQLY